MNVMLFEQNQKPQEAELKKKYVVISRDLLEKAL